MSSIHEIMNNNNKQNAVVSDYNAGDSSAGKFMKVDLTRKCSRVPR